jgi:hypothetical protein
MVEIRRKLYKRGSSFETTIPMPLLFALDKDKKYHVVFKFDDSKHRWYVEFEPLESSEKQKKEEKA